MDQAIPAVMNTQNIALILSVCACVGLFLFLIVSRKEERQDRAARDAAAALERQTLYALVQQNTAALHELRNTLSALNGKVF